MQPGTCLYPGAGENLGLQRPGHLLGPSPVVDHRGFHPEIDIVADLDDVKTLQRQEGPGEVGQILRAGAVANFDTGIGSLCGSQGDPALAGYQLRGYRDAVAALGVGGRAGSAGSGARTITGAAVSLAAMDRGGGPGSGVGALTAGGARASLPQVSGPSCGAEPPDRVPTRP